MHSTLPKSFVERVLSDEYLGEPLLKALIETPPTAIRINPLKNNSVWSDSSPIPWSRNGLFLPERPSFTLDPHFHGGAYYPQEAGSQFIDRVLQQIQLPENPVLLDLCAAPGGKSSLILAHLNGNGLLISNEINKSRASILKENLNRWGAYNAVITSNEPEKFSSLHSTFDCVLIDAPCSGEGMFRKDEGARNEWSESNVLICTNRQRDIVASVWDSIKEDGYLIYSTCTFNRNENEDNIAWILNQFSCEVIRFEGIEASADRNNFGYYSLPNKLMTEGFYFCVLQKKSSEKLQKLKSKQKSTLHVFKDEKLISNWIQSREETTLVQWQEYIFAIPKHHAVLIQHIHTNFHTIKLGTELGELSKKGLLPNQALANDMLLQSEQLSKVELTKEQALLYLKGETFHLEVNAGYHLMCFEHTVLGWIKHLGNRFNNLYPKENRIRMRIDN